MYRTALPVLLGLALPLYSQAIPTASRAADIQIGVGYASGRPDYIHHTFPGITAYADIDLRPHFGAEIEFHSIVDSSGSQMSERTYELGGRYRRTYGVFVPYAKGMFGLGQFKYPQGLTTLDYWLFAGGVGADIRLTDRIRVRSEYEYQRWMGFSNGGLSPQIVTFAVAYHFPARLRSR
jgi:opacity protein-like surface antigen